MGVIHTGVGQWQLSWTDELLSELVLSASTWTGVQMGIGDLQLNIARQSVHDSTAHRCAVP